MFSKTSSSCVLFQPLSNLYMVIEHNELTWKYQGIINRNCKCKSLSELQPAFLVDQQSLPRVLGLDLPTQISSAE
ncbi:hypothetical protein G4B88_019885 [Cannabis sativa]|uniref:Uncharacterized protein n=1 Tax=Cannabis sativa TaxID=3483 RepID=A0A7J6HS99_CANSA|nr:hypothetical protein G4B88_019885 [Cannabis sativa]